MGIGRDSRHKRRLTGGRRAIHQKKRAFEKARPVSMTKIAEKRVRVVRVRGGNLKFRALRLNQGNFNWASEACTRKVKVLEVIYNSTNNELVRTNTLVKNCIVQIDATPFKAWFLEHYGVELGVKKGGKGKKPTDNVEEKPVVKKSKHVLAKLEKRRQEAGIVDKSEKDKDQRDTKVMDQFTQGRLLACISSRPGQSGRVDGYILEGKELDFYIKKIEKKK